MVSLEGVPCRGESPRLREVFKEGKFVPPPLRAGAASGHLSCHQEAEWSTQGPTQPPAS